MIERHPQGAAASHYDLIIVGGGIYGVALTFEASAARLRPLLLEEGDYGHATTWNSLRIVHGGLRYLQSLDLHRFRESVAERSWFLRRFPDLVEPLPCLMPLYNRGLKRRSVLRAALKANDWLSRHKNDGLRQDRRLHRGRVLDRNATADLFPLVDRRGLAGGALWYDACMPDSQRLVIELLRWAVSRGARALNYVRAENLLLEDGEVRGIAARDTESHEKWEFRAPVVVNCAGPWCRDVGRRFDRDVPGLFRHSLAFNVLFDREPPSQAAVAVAPGAGGRTYFLHPWKGKLFAGTYHAGLPAGALPTAVDPSCLAAFIADLNQAVPGIEVDAAAILRVHWGFLPARRAGEDRLSAREVLYDHGRCGGPRGFYSVSGVKFTTARRVAEKTIRRVHRRSFARDEGSRPVPASIPTAETFLRLAEDESETARGVLRRIVEEESVVRLDDLVLRRTDWGTLPATAAKTRRIALGLLEGDTAPDDAACRFGSLR